MREDTLEAMLRTYREELTQIRYTPAFAEYKRRSKVVAVSKKVRKQLDDNALLKKLEKFSAPEDEGPLPKKAGARRR